MNSIAATQNTAYYTATTTAYTAAKSTNTQTTADTGAQASASSATNIELSDEAKAVLAGKDFATIASDMRAKFDALLLDAGLTSPYKDGELVIDLTGVDRRSLFAASSNSGDQFSNDEQTAAKEELALRFDAALAGPAAVARVINDLSELYDAGAAFMDAASDEEKASVQWIENREALTEARAVVDANHSALPDVENDPVVDYLIREKAGDVGQSRSFSNVAIDARVVLDKQIDEAKALGKSGRDVDFAEFSGRSLSAIVLDEGEQFSRSEIFKAKTEIDSRARTALLTSLTNASESGDPTALAKNIISVFSSLSVEERAAVGWSDELYETAVSNYQSASKIAEMFGASTSGGARSLLSFL